MKTGQRIEPRAGDFEHLDQILESSPVPIFVLDLQHRITHWNRACEVVLGFSAAQMLGTTNQWRPFYSRRRPVMADLIVSGELEAGIETYYANKFRRSEVVPGSYEAEDFFPNIGVQGLWLYFTAAPLHDREGRLTGAIETLQDISGQRRADAALRREHQILNTVVEHFPGGVAVIDADLQVIKFNRQLQSLLGMPDELFVPPNPLEKFIRFNAERGEYGLVDVDAYVEQSIALARAQLAHCFERTRPDGKVLEIRGSPLPGGGFVTSYMDITERKQAEAEILRLLAEQRLIFDNAHVGIVWVCQRKIVRCNRRMAEMFRFADPELLVGQSTRLLYHSDMQWEAVGASMYADLERDGAAQAEHSMRQSDGTEIWVMITGRPISQADVQGSSIWVYTDVTMRHRQEAELRLAKKVFANTSDALLVTDCHGVIIDVNPAFSRITGYERDEIIGKTPAYMKSGRHDAIFYDAMWRSVIDSGHWEGEVWDRRKDGALYPKWLAITTVRDADGKVVNYVGAFSDITERKAAEEKIQFLAHHDPLTGLPNRLLLRERFQQVTSLLQRHGGLAALMFLDLDHFKRINDSLGHRVGDQLLVAVVKRLQQLLRSSDTLSRQGGDEFVLLLANIEAGIVAAQVAEKILLALQQPFDIGEHQLLTSASIGIVLAPVDGQDFDSLLQRADTAMYAAKERGRGAYRFFELHMDELARRRLALTNSLRLALEREEFRLFYQPQLLMASQRVCGCEALLRWPAEQGVVASPAEFIPLAEEAGLILPLGAWVMRMACQQARRWQDAGLTCRVAVNVSGGQVERDDMVALLRDATREAGIRPQQIQIELTESSLISDSVDVQEVIAGLKALGASIAIDDFGTGYSSLAYLKRFRVDKLKIDRSFIADAPSNEESAAMCRAVIGIASSLNISAIAEGVETAEQLALLRAAGCHEVQGFYYSRALPADDFYRFASAHQ